MYASSKSSKIIQSEVIQKNKIAAAVVSGGGGGSGLSRKTSFK